jgi:hypothetical protein
MKNIFYPYHFIKISLLGVLMLFIVGCLNDLDTIPLDEDIVTSGTVYGADLEPYTQVLAKLYAGLAVSGQEGPSGKPDISGIDEGFGQYLRGLWYHQELTTDEAVIGWNDQTIKDFHGHTWGSDDGFTFAFYSRVFYQIPLCNEFLRETTDEKLDERGAGESVRETVQLYRAEARFLRALSYWHALDIFRNVPFVTEDDKVGSFFPEQIQGPDLFAYIESELKAIENEISPVGTAEYGRADQGAVWTLLAKLYLNAEVYAGTPKYAESLEYSEKVINSNAYTLDPNYQQVFLADNHNSPEMIFPVTFDGVYTKTWGGTTFIIRAGIGGSMDPVASGVASGWGGTRTTKEFVAKFPETTGGFVVRPVESPNFPSVYVIGDFQGWDISDSLDLGVISSPTSNKIYEGYKYFDQDNSEFIIAQYPGGGAPHGDNGADGTLDIGGANIVAGEAGMYYIQADFSVASNKKYILEKRDWTIAGDAVQGWENDVALQWDAGKNAYVATVELTAGEMKFRANSDWVVNLGDTGMDGLLEYDGDNIVIVEGGNYDIELYLNKPYYTYSLKNNSTDSRGYFYKDGQNLEINDLTQFTEGYAIDKFKNVDINGNGGSNPEHVDTDFPMFRLADVYLMAAEAIMRSSGNMDQAVEYYNTVRRRAFRGSTAGDITAAELTLDELLDERGRELYWECHRRTDLIRFGKFTGADYLWEWKGGVKEGKSTESFRNIFPIPSADISANTNLEQNPGY